MRCVLYSASGILILLLLYLLCQERGSESRLRLHVHLTKPTAAVRMPLPVEVRIANEGTEDVLVQSGGDTGFTFEMNVHELDGTPIVYPHGNLCCDAICEMGIGDFEVLQPGQSSQPLWNCWLRSGLADPGRYRIQFTYRRVERTNAGIVDWLLSLLDKDPVGRVDGAAFHGTLTETREIEVARWRPDMGGRTR